ncbi:hypothetical protein PYCCODRAFT_90041 [Trametes coccinea BRFM310]|uniref:F-box domain-containing protein n=1 Tax=Trametes coccinea (strain BRFM310) TaxID=1353009 RepID=A0A1Y2I7B5_TRAC3|nr:hypothetical protein PYCCODRAFT_90041 [Trametes coccinea BRFM310]
MSFQLSFLCAVPVYPTQSPTNLPYTHCRLLTWMLIPRLPLELWHVILDYCAPVQVDITSLRLFQSPSHGGGSGERDTPECARTLMACALTCRDWVSRSIYNYYASCVMLRRPEDVERLSDLITKRPHLAALIRILSIEPEHRGFERHRQASFISFARTRLAQQLTNLHSVVYTGSPSTLWPYPTAYNLPIAQYRSLRTLCLSTTFRRPVDMCRLVWAVEKLQNLLLPKIRFISGWDDPLDPGFEKLQNLAARKPRCTSLETLVLDVSNNAVPWRLRLRPAFESLVCER